MEITICDICKTNPATKVNMLPTKLWKFEYKQKWWRVKSEKKTVCEYCLEKIFNKI